MTNPPGNPAKWPPTLCAVLLLSGLALVNEIVTLGNPNSNSPSVVSPGGIEDDIRPLIDIIPNRDWKQLT